jgi:hypothetical protein
MRRIVLSIGAVALLAAMVPALAQEKAAPSQVPIPKGVFVKGQVAGQYLARDRLIGASVHNATGHIVGDIEDLIVGANNEIQGVIMGTGGYFGAGEKKVGVRLSALQFSQKEGRTVVTLPAASKEVLSALEPFKRAQPRRSFIDRAKDKAQELTDKTTDSAGPAYEQAKEKAKQAYEAAREQAGPAYERAKTAAKEAYDKAVQSAREAYDKATQPEPPKQQ